MAKFPALMLWTDAFIADTHHLSMQEVGAYVRLLMTAWRRPTCDLPDDEVFLARSVGATGRQWAKVGPVVMAFWDQGENGCFTQKRLSKEHRFVEAARTQRVRAGRASALKRLNSGSTVVDLPSVREGNPHTHTLPLPSEEEVLSPPSGKKLADAIETEFLLWYAEYPQKVARAAGLRAWRAARKKTTVAILTEKLAVYKRTKPPDQSWKHPATWLNGECWLDEYGPSGVTRGKPFSM